MRNLDIGEVAAQCGLPTSTLRFYEERGLIKSIGRRGLRRVFPAGVIERLTLIALGRSAGFSLEEIAAMFAPDGRLRVDRQKLAAKAKELDATIRRLSTVSKALRHAANCKAPSHIECPKFRRIMKAAAGRPVDTRTKAARKALGVNRVGQRATTSAATRPWRRMS